MSRGDKRRESSEACSREDVGGRIEEEGDAAFQPLTVQGTSRILSGLSRESWTLFEVLVFFQIIQGAALFRASSKNHIPAEDSGFFGFCKLPSLCGESAILVVSSQNQAGSA